MPAREPGLQQSLAISIAPIACTEFRFVACATLTALRRITAFKDPLVIYARATVSFSTPFAPHELQRWLP
jgi:hypothetical protein